MGLMLEGFGRLIARAKAAGRLRPDFAHQDLTIVLIANAGIVGGAPDVACAASKRLVAYLLQAFAAHEKMSKHLMDNQLALPAYEQLLKGAHTFNLLDARGAISVTERAAYIGRIRNLARAVAQSYLESRARLGFPMAPKAWADEVIAQIDKKKAA